MIARHLAAAAVLGVSIALSASAHAQDSSQASPRRPDRAPSEFALRSSGSIAFMQSRPMGALEQNIGFGYGANGAWVFRLDRAGIWSLRVDAGVLEYGNESIRVPLSSTIGGRIQVKVSTSNNVVPFSIGPQLTWPSGRVRPYLNAGVGGQVFFTESHVEGTDDTNSFASTTNQSDVTPTWTAGGGLYLPLYEGRTKVLLDIGAQYLGGGRASYLRPGSIVDLSNSQIQINKLESTTHMLLVRIGVKLGL